ncbi:hypothetical protein DSO57_1006409 [Entomophthora muscae]|uniref:Uncharacterized protein n=1 Tax=Entomophthora muscae TaxID=34485 RepID=A0ACC2TIS0_9FUNG|nr:hypothetical protein DSO57_1006409 [Entomophthora muscae]
MDFNSLYKIRFATTVEAVDACQRCAHGEGFSVRIRTSKASTVYIVCSKEGKPEHKAIEPKKRNRSSERCHCGWRIVLSYNPSAPTPQKWEFRQGKTMTHNHPLIYHHGRHPALYPLPQCYPFAPLSIKRASTRLPPIHLVLGHIPDYMPSSRTLSPAPTKEDKPSHSRALLQQILN